MSTQSIRSIIINQISLVISNSRNQIEEEGRKKIGDLKNEIPSDPEEYITKLGADVNENTCSKKGKEKFDQKLNKSLISMRKIINYVLFFVNLLKK